MKQIVFMYAECCSIAQWCPTLCDPVDCSMPGFSVLHHLLEFAQTHVHWVSDVIQSSHPLSPPSPPALNLSQHQGLFQWIDSSHQMAKVLQLQLQHQSFQWNSGLIPLRMDWFHLLTVQGSKTYCLLVNQGTFQGTDLHFQLFLIRLIKKKKKIALHTAVTLKQYLKLII